jgi:hypothetical protein
MIPCPQCQHPCKNEYGIRVHQSRKHPEVISNNCRMCGNKLTLENQRPYDRKKHRHICRLCHNIYLREYNNNHPRKYHHNYDEENRYNRNRQRKIKLEMIEAYGGKCCCCGEEHFEFLCIDHIYTDGSIERNSKEHRGRLVNGGSALYRYLKKMGWPKDRYRLLCNNCNWSRAVFGYCPHQTQLELFSIQSRVDRNYSD